MVDGAVLGDPRFSWPMGVSILIHTSTLVKSDTFDGAGDGVIHNISWITFTSIDTSLVTDLWEGFGTGGWARRGANRWMGIQWASQWTVDLVTPVLVHLLLWNGELAVLEEIGELGTLVSWITTQIIDAIVIEVLQSIISESLAGTEDSKSKFGLLNWVTGLGSGLDIAICVVIERLAVDTILLAGTEDKELVGDPRIFSLHEICMIVIFRLATGFDLQDSSILIDNIIQLLSINISSQSAKSGWSIELWDVWDLDTKGVVGGEGDNDSLLVLNGESGSRVTDTDCPGLQVGVVPWGENLNSVDQGGFRATVNVDG